MSEWLEGSSSSQMQCTPHTAAACRHISASCFDIPGTLRQVVDVQASCRICFARKYLQVNVGKHEETALRLSSMVEANIYFAVSRTPAC